MHDILISFVSLVLAPVAVVIGLYLAYHFIRACYLAWMFSQIVGWRTPRRGR